MRKILGKLDAVWLSCSAANLAMSLANLCWGTWLWVGISGAAALSCLFCAWAIGDDPHPVI